MTLFALLLHHLQAALLALAIGLLLEELTYGGLVRLILAPWPGQEKSHERNHINGEKSCSR